MYPVIIQIGPIIVYSLWLFAGIALLCSVFIFEYLAKTKRLQMNFVYHHSFSIFIWGLIGARLIFILKYYNIYFQDLSIGSFASILYIWDKGLSLLGAILGITLALIYFSIKEKEQTKRWIDILTISIISGLGIGHIGTFLDGSAYGRETNLPWGMIFESPSIQYAVPIHPIQLYAMLYSFIIAFILFIFYKKNKFKAGIITIIGILSYLTLTFLEGFIRGDDALIFLGIREEQWFSLVAILLTGTYLFIRYNKRRRKKQSSHTKNHA